jgi:hypothetical protein
MARMDGGGEGGMCASLGRQNNYSLGRRSRLQDWKNWMKKGANKAKDKLKQGFEAIGDGLKHMVGQ